MSSFRVDPAEKSAVKPRPGWLKALGSQSLPETASIRGRSHRLREVFKHDSWAATGLYEGPSGELTVVKLHRRAPVLGVPMGWLGRRMARHETKLLSALSDLKGLPALVGQVSVGGKVLPNAVARTYIEGHPLGNRESVNEAFYPTLGAMLRSMHDRKIAYVDLHKRENILVDANGEPCLIDFQISVAWPRWLPAGPLFALLRRSDEYHLMKHWSRSRPEQCGFDERTLRRRIPWPIRAHRLVARPLRELRRRLLVRLGVRSGKGRVETELFAEHALRQDSQNTHQPAG
jgi:hypothetical protein